MKIIKDILSTLDYEVPVADVRQGTCIHVNRYFIGSLTRPIRH
jgi:hypothetical protein